jgi:cysteine desulfurase/selenocysteine lyase
VIGLTLIEYFKINQTIGRVYVFKNQFPFFTNKPEQVYLDSAATTQKHQSVIQAVNDYHCLSSATVHRSAYAIANDATLLYEQARDLTAQLINSHTNEQIVFNSGATESINTIASGLQQHMIAGHKILILASEHHANILPWQRLSARLGLSIEVVNISEQGQFTQLEYAAFLKQLNSDVAILAMAHVSNALGNIYPVKEVCRLANQQNILTIIDGTQAIAHMPVDVTAIDCDFYVFSGHKMYAPTGVGVMYGKSSLLNGLLPLRLGGEMITRVSFTEAEYQASPLKFEGGTPNVSGVIGLGAAATFLKLNMASIQQHEILLFKLLSDGLEKRNDIRLLGNILACNQSQANQRNQNAGQEILGCSIALHSFVFTNHHLHDVATLIYQKNIAVRVGHHCAMPLMNVLNITGTMRVSVGCYTTEQDIQYFLRALDSTLAELDESAGSQLITKSEQQDITPLTDKKNKSNSINHVNDNSTVGKVSEALPISFNIKQAKGWDNQYRQLLLASKDLNVLPFEMRLHENAVFGCESNLWIAYYNDQLCAYSQSKIIRGILALLLEKVRHLNTPLTNNRSVPKNTSAAACFDYFTYLAELNLTPFFSVGRQDGIQNAITAIKAKLAIRNKI